MATKTKKKSDAMSFLDEVIGEPLTLGSLVTSIRLCDDLTQLELARRLHLPPQHLCDIEKGRRGVSPERAAAIAKELGYSVPQFVELAVQDQLRAAGLNLIVKVGAA